MSGTFLLGYFPRPSKSLILRVVSLHFWSLPSDLGTHQCALAPCARAAGRQRAALLSLLKPRGGGRWLLAFSG